MQHLDLGTFALGRLQYINIRKETASPLSLETLKEKAWDILEEACFQGVRYFDTVQNFYISPWPIFSLYFVT